MIAEYESFVDGDAGRCGAILRHLTPTSLRTRTVFRMGIDAPLYLVDHLIEHDGDVRHWTRFTYDSPTSAISHEGNRDPDGTVHIELGREAREATNLADGTQVQAERIQLVVSGQPTHAHWCVDGVVVKSDWSGAQSFRTDDPTALMAGLDDEVAAHIRDFASQLV